MSTPCSRVLRTRTVIPQVPTHKLDLEDLSNNPRAPKRLKIADPTSPPRHRDVAPTVPKTPAPQDSSKSTGKRKSPLERASKYSQCLCLVPLLTLKQKKTLQSYRHRPPAIELSFHAMISTRPTTHMNPSKLEGFDFTPAKLLGSLFWMVLAMFSLSL
jgi:hypothetical protein